MQTKNTKALLEMIEDSKSTKKAIRLKFPLSIFLVGQIYGIVAQYFTFHCSHQIANCPLSELSRPVTSDFFVL